MVHDAAPDANAGRHPDSGAELDAASEEDAAAGREASVEGTPDAPSEASSGDTYVLIDDMQTGGGKIVIGTGAWFAVNDGTDGGVEIPGTKATFSDTLLSPPRTVPEFLRSFTGNPSTLGVRASGSGFKYYAGLGLNFEKPRAAFPVNDYDGIVFWGRLGGDAGSISVGVLFPDTNTDPQGGVCTHCFDDLSMNVTFTTTWQEFKVPFASLKQSGFGSPKETTLASAGIYAIQFQASTIDPAGQAFDLWIDDIYFYTGP
jgi:hypothetical protein